MNRKYASVQPSIWTSPTGREWRRLGPAYQLLGLYLITNPHASAYGLYYLPMVIITEETGVARGLVKAVLRSFEDQRFAYYDEPTEWVWIVNMASRQLALTSTPNPNAPVIRGVRLWYQGCSPNPFLGPFYDQYAPVFALDARRDGGRWQPPVIADVAPGDPTARAMALEHFERFWLAYPKKHGKRAALAEWLNIKPLPTAAFTDAAIAAIERQRTHVDWVKDSGQWIPDPERWIKKGRWLDERALLPAVSDDDAQRVLAMTDWLTKGGKGDDD